MGKNKEKKVLVIEDDADISKVLKKRLEESGFSVVQASDGYEGLYKYLREHPQLVILDIILPKLNGYEVCREIRREIKDTRTPIIMLTAKGEDYDRIKGRVIGATQYITKPFEWPDLLGTIMKYVH